ncbi:LacI family DNA-binding transcriptional regulator [Streptomyces sp. NPDC008343]|uniref:LacI family DNA-binding transcriptional regulator n=1 Tax=Streptomyces sp. NPDC008343 TaxID=3364828 RepID=UPI0036EF932D
MQPSIEDVAAAAGVSTASVSRSLRGLKGVSEKTRNHVIEVARDLGYSISPGAASLRTGRTRSIAVITPYIDRWFFGRALGGVESVLQQADLQLVLHSLHGSAQARERLFEDRLLHRRVDAVLIMCLQLTDAEVEAIHGLGIPAVMLGAQAEGLFSVTIDDFSAARQAVRHLINLGHERIALIGGRRDDPLHFTAPAERRAGYREALSAASLPSPPELEVQADFTVRGGERAMASLLSLAEPPTAVFAESDEMAFGALKVLHDSRLRVPAGMSLVGFDDHEMSHLVNLTTIAQPVAEQGAAAARALLARLEQAEIPPLQASFATELLIRGTTAPPRR